MQLLERNRKYFDKSGVVRKVVSNLKISTELEVEFAGFIEYWTDPYQLVKLRDCDVVWDEMATHLDSTQWQNMPLDLKRWFQQHRKFGIEIVGNTQDFAMIDISVRRLVEVLYLLQKVFGSRDKSATRPDPKRVWGLIWLRSLNPQDYKEDKKVAKASMSFNFLWISKKLIDVYDTRQEITMGKYPPLKHIERVCETCHSTKIIHA